MDRKQKTWLLFSVAMLIVVLGGIIVSITTSDIDTGSATITSKHKTISLQQTGKQIHATSELSGTVREENTARLFYAVQGIGSLGFVDGGNIPVQPNGSFAHHINLPQDLRKGSALEIKIYTRTSSGQIIDQLSTSVVYTPEIQKLTPE